MKTTTFDENINIPSNKYKNISDSIESNYSNSNIDNKYEVASKMKDNGLPNNFIKNFVKSYE